jgi:LmbE family N-acetylglucosaminyl deacetylase
MRVLSLGERGSTLDLLCIGAHADDIEIGAGGTILQLAEDGRLGSVRWIVLSGSAERAVEARNAAEAFLSGAAAAEIIVESFTESYFPAELSAIKDRFERLKDGHLPDVVFSHRREDLHQDHRLAAELTWNTFRDHLILEYEIPKYEGDLGAPNLFVELTEPVLERKVELIGTTFRSQRARDWFDADTFRSMARIRGLESRSRTRYAEGFQARKTVLATTSR